MPHLNKIALSADDTRKYANIYFFLLALLLISLALHSLYIFIIIIQSIVVIRPKDSDPDMLYKEFCSRPGCNRQVHDCKQWTRYLLGLHESTLSNLNQDHSFKRCSRCRLCTRGFGGHGGDKKTPLRYQDQLRIYCLAMYMK